jgi:hypothetical protein
VTIVPSDGFTTGLQAPSPDATHAPSMYRLGTDDLVRGWERRLAPPAPLAPATARMARRRDAVNGTSRAVD